MSYIESTLTPDEKLIYFAHPHPIVFLGSFLWFSLAAFLFLFGSNFPHLPHVFFSLIALLLCCVSLVFAAIKFFFTEYGITNKRIIVKVGFIEQQAFEIFLTRLEGVYTTQSILGRMFNYGTVMISGIGGNKDSFYLVQDPIFFRSRIQTQLQNK